MKNSPYQTFQYGFPESVIGSLFPVFDIKYYLCSTSINISDECLRSYLAERCLGFFIPDKRNQKNCYFYYDNYENYRIEFVEENNGLINEKTFYEIESVVIDCIKNPDFLLPYLCGWEYFHKLYVNPENGTISQLTNFQLISTMYIYFYCNNTLMTKDNEIDIFCPNPCLSASVSCNSDLNAWDGVCIIKKSGLYYTDYVCLCSPGYHWSAVNKQCIRIDNCLSRNDTIFPCNRKGTKICLHNYGTNEVEVYVCICEYGFMGSRCDLPRNACLQRYQPQLISGNRACQIYLGNECIPYLNTDSYECHCQPNWKNDNSMSFPNCFRFVTKCDGKVCYNNGQCITSEDGTKALCNCGNVWSGSLCKNLKLDMWLLWEPWSYCTVTCGKGWRIRRRICRTGDSNDCSGNDRDLIPCSRNCQKFSDRYRPSLKMIILVQGSILLIVLFYMIAYIRLKVEMVNITKSIIDEKGEMIETRKVAKWFENRNLLIRQRISTLHSLRSQHHKKSSKALNDFQ